MVCRLGAEDSKVLPLRIGPDGVGASAVGMGESLYGIAPSRLVHRWHWHSEVSCILGLVSETMAVQKSGLYHIFFSF